MTLTLPHELPVNFPGAWRNNVLNHGKIKLIPNDVEEIEEGKYQLKESKTREIGDVFCALRTVVFPDTLSLFKGDDLKKAIEKAKQVVYRTFLQVTFFFNNAFPEHFELGEDKVLIPTFTDFQNKLKGIDIHTEGGQCVKKLQALTYMPSTIQGELTLYNLFDPSIGKCDNRNLKAVKPRLDFVTLNDLNPDNLPSVFMVDGEMGTAHSAKVPYKDSANHERIIWTIIINKMKRVEFDSLIPDFHNWLEEDILRFARGEKREEGEIRSTLTSYTL